jgi:SAM-dependent methyltransferase
MSPADLLRQPTTDPSAIYALRDGLYSADMLVAALRELDFFTWLDERGPSTVAEVAAALNLVPRPVDVMTTLFVAQGFLERRGDAVAVTPLAREHLTAGSPWGLRPYFPKLADRPVAQQLVEILRTGRPARFAGRKDHEDWHQAMETEAFAEEFTATMDCRGLFLAEVLGRSLDLAGAQLLDVGGGSAVYACSLAARFPGLRATVLEKSPVDRIAMRNIARRGLADRVSVRTQDFFSEPFPTGFDVHLCSNVLHDWDEPDVRRLLGASAAALGAGGRLIVHDMFLDATKAGPLRTAEYSVLLMHVTQGRCYSDREVITWADEVGFRCEGHVPGGAGRSALVLVKS